MHGLLAGSPTRVDGHAATATTIVAELEDAIDEVTRATEARQADELRALDAEMERRGYEQRIAQGRKRRLAERHKRELTRLRREVLLEGVTALESVYRDALDGARPIGAGRAPAVAPMAATHALAACRRAREALLANEKGALHVLRLLLALPVPGGRPPQRG